MENITRENAFFMAQILSKTDRQQDTIDLIKKVIEMNPDLNNEEQSFLSIVYKNIVDKKREGLANLYNIIRDDQSICNNQTYYQKIQTYAHEFVEELDFYGNELISIINEKLLPIASTPKNKVFYLTLKADYYRYLSEFHFHHISGEENNELASHAEQAYKEALLTASENLSPTKTEYLGLILNYTVFLHDILDKKDDALDLANKTYQELISKVSDSDSRDVQKLMTLLKENIEKWS